ncbi:MAG: membrane protein insertion efficiency factor YidD [Minisyncoccia bacterium]
MKWIDSIGIGSIRLYQRLASPILSRWIQCRFYPTCSEYACLSIQKYGFWNGAKRAVNRLKRCNKYNRESCMDLP